MEYIWNINVEKNSFSSNNYLLKTVVKTAKE